MACRYTKACVFPAGQDGYCAAHSQIVGLAAVQVQEVAYKLLAEEIGLRQHFRSRRSSASRKKAA